MARPARSQDEVDKIKSTILESALGILVEEGFNGFSMGKLGKQMGMTTANLYNYYKNKDELYNLIIIRGYDILYSVLCEVVEDEPDPLEKVMALFNAYVEFGIRNAHYYHLMFTMSSPKYLDYVGTESEGIAQLEKDNSLKVLGFVVAVINEYTDGHPGYSGIDAKLIALQFWGQLHGLISLSNSGNLREADESPERVIGVILENIKIIIMRGLT
ncbi:hypothetical protein A9Q99_20990 [Gammaproteobacteria bacterium 45_16_T64]|nr:hypothetical protein A9Q99_20990 [Gammaproteobacteria bacterium 45_16_T64]